MDRIIVNEHWIGTQDLCKYLGVHRLTIMSWIKEGMPAHKVCGHWLYRVSEVDKWIKKHGSK